MGRVADNVPGTCCWAGANCNGLLCWVMFLHVSAPSRLTPTSQSHLTVSLLEPGHLKHNRPFATVAHVMCFSRTH